MGIGRDEAAWLFRSILGREADGEDVIHWLSTTYDDIPTARRVLLDSAEFRYAYRGMQPEPPSTSTMRDRAFSHEQLRAWFGRDIIKTANVDDLRKYINHHRNVISIDNEEVSAQERPAHFIHPQNDIFDYRIGLFVDLIRDAVKAYQLRLQLNIIIDVEDLAAEVEGLPIFSYQRGPGSSIICFPDVEFMGHQYYEKNFPPDLRDYGDKTPTAAFVGSTSGYPYVLTRAAVEQGLSPRLRAAAFFRDVADVDFRVTNIVQTDGPDTEQLIRNSGLISSPVSFDNSYSHKFIISMDGNGATCSRVAMALRSNSVLLKYRSDYSLFYFSALQPWLHYIPIETNDDVLRIIRAERAKPGRFQYIADASAQFYNKCLQREAIIRYTARLLADYADLVDSAPN